MLQVDRDRPTMCRTSRDVFTVSLARGTQPEVSKSGVSVAVGGRTAVGGPLWVDCCGRAAVGGPLWAGCCGWAAVGGPL